MYKFSEAIFEKFSGLKILKLFQNPQAEGAANMIKGMSSYICDTADIPNYVQKSQRTGECFFLVKFSKKNIFFSCRAGSIPNIRNEKSPRSRFSWTYI